MISESQLMIKIVRLIALWRLSDEYLDCFYIDALFYKYVIGKISLEDLDKEIRLVILFRERRAK